MGFYAVLNTVHQVLSRRRWQLRLCRREGDHALRYYVLDANARVLTAGAGHRRVGLTLQELLVWLDQQGDCELSNHVHFMREKLASVA